MTMPGTKTYVVTKPDLIQAIQKQPQEFAFPPIVAQFSSKVCCSGADAQKILLKNVNGDDGDWGLSMESYAAMRAALSSGLSLDDMKRVMIQSIAASLDDLQASTSGHTILHWPSGYARV